MHFLKEIGGIFETILPLLTPLNPQKEAFFKKLSLN